MTDTSAPQPGHTAGCICATDDIVRVWNIRYQDAQLKNSLSFHLEPSGSNQSKPILNLFRPIKKMGTRKCTLRSFPNHKRQRRSRKTSFAAHHDKGIKVVARIFDLSSTALVTSHRVVTGSDDNYCTSLQHPICHNSSLNTNLTKKYKKMKFSAAVLLASVGSAAAFSGSS